MGHSNVWAESLWLTHRESVTITDPVTGATITRDVSAGLTVKSDKSARSTEMYDAARAALNRIVETEKETWLDDRLMKDEAERLKKIREEQKDGTGESGAKEEGKDTGSPAGPAQ